MPHPARPARSTSRSSRPRAPARAVDCKHTVATLLASNSSRARDARRSQPRRGGARLHRRRAGRPRPRSLSASSCVSACGAAPRVGAVRVESASPRGAASVRRRRARGLRPLERSADRGLDQGRVSWDASAARARLRAAQARGSPSCTASPATCGCSGRFSDVSEWLTLDDVESRLLWPHLAQAASGRHRRSCRRRSTPRRARVAAAADDGRASAHRGRELDLSAARHDRRRADRCRAARARSATSASTGSRCERERIELTLAPLAARRTACTRCSTRTGRVTVPAADADEFVREHLPRIVRQVEVDAPGIDAARRRSARRSSSTVRFAPGAPARRSPWSGGTPAAAGSRSASDADRDRDEAAEDDLRARVERSWRIRHAGAVRGSGRCRGIEAAEFVARTAARARGPRRRRGSRSHGERPRYRELTGDPHVSVSHGREHRPRLVRPRRHRDDRRAHDPVRAAVHGALARRRKKLLLSDGRYFSLAHPSLAAAARPHRRGRRAGRVGDRSPRISRYQTDLWADFEDLADEAEPAVSWRATAEGAARRATDRADAGARPGSRAELRPVPARRLRLARVPLASTASAASSPTTWASARRCRCCADRARARDAGEARPFLVVAPTSVHVDLAQRGGPLRPGPARDVVDATRAKRGIARERMPRHPPIVVITSYTLLRLDEAEFAKRGVGGARARRGAVRQEQPDEGVPRSARPAAPT